MVIESTNGKGKTDKVYKLQLPILAFYNHLTTSIFGRRHQHDVNTKSVNCPSDITSLRKITRKHQKNKYILIFDQQMSSINLKDPEGAQPLYKIINKWIRKKIHTQVGLTENYEKKRIHDNKYPILKKGTISS